MMMNVEEVVRQKMLRGEVTKDEYEHIASTLARARARSRTTSGRSILGASVAGADDGVVGGESGRGGRSGAANSQLQSDDDDNINGDDGRLRTESLPVVVGGGVGESSDVFDFLHSAASLASPPASSSFAATNNRHTVALGSRSPSDPSSSLSSTSSSQLISSKHRSVGSFCKVQAYCVAAITTDSSSVPALARPLHNCLVTDRCMPCDPCPCD